MKRGLLFDLDNTLLECGQYYIDAQNEFIQAVHTATGLDRTFIAKILQAIDVESCALSDGFSKVRFPRSFSAASLALDVVAGHPPDTARANRMFDIGNSVFSAPYPMYEGVPELLIKSINNGYKLILVSKGESDVQQRKLNMNGLDMFFHPYNTYFVLKKNKELFQRVAAEQGINPADSWMVGDSLRDDIGPAKEAGFNTIEVSSRTGRWAYENETHKADFTVFNVTEIENILLTNKATA